MPTVVLLPVFALLLLLNAALILLAIRGMRGERAPGRRIERPRPLSPATVQPTTRRAPQEPMAGAGEPSAPLPPATRGDPEPATAKSRGPAIAVSRVAAPPTPSARSASSDPSRPAHPGESRHPVKRGRRRRFALPPLDDDHDRVSRSIETFLTGSEGLDTPIASGPNRAKVATLTTVALVAVEGLPAVADVAGTDNADVIAATVGRALRGAARATDRVSEIGGGRYRIVLPATTELAARSYLRRVRATVEPTLEAADGPVRLLIVTASAPAGEVASALATAERQLHASRRPATQYTTAANAKRRSRRAAGD